MNTVCPLLSPGVEILVCSGHSDSVTHVSFNHDGKFLATADMAGNLQVWSMADRKQVLCKVEYVSNPKTAWLTINLNLLDKLVVLFWAFLKQRIWKCWRIFAVIVDFRFYRACVHIQLFIFIFVISERTLPALWLSFLGLKHHGLKLIPTYLDQHLHRQTKQTDKKSDRNKRKNSGFSMIPHLWNLLILLPFFVGTFK